MTPLMVKGTLFGLLLLSAAVWDMRNREIPNLIPILLFLCGLIGFRPAASTAGLLLVGGPFLLAAVLIKRDGFAIGGGDVKLMGACGFVLGVWPGLIQAVLSLSLAVLTGLVECRLQKQPLSAVRLPLAPFFCCAAPFCVRKRSAYAAPVCAPLPEHITCGSESAFCPAGFSLK